MAEQYLRKVSVLIGEASKVRDVSDLHCVFSVEAMTINTPKIAYLRIYNLAPETLKEIIDEGTQLTIAAGYRENFSRIFTGQITQSRIGRENGTDTYLDITAADGDKAFNFTLLNLSVSSGTDIVTRLQMLANAAGMKLGVVQAPPDGAKLSRGRSYFGLLRDHLTAEAASIGANWSFDNGTIHVVNVGGYLPGEIPKITPSSGMIGTPEQLDIGVQVRCLLNPHLQQNMLVKLEGVIQQHQLSLNIQGLASELGNYVGALSADGIYKVLYVNHFGDTRGQDWYSDFVGYARPAVEGALQQLDYLPTLSGTY